jgi:hypothetical protein
MSKLLLKQRAWDENIWRLLVFAVTIIIAVWVVWLLAYFYNTSKNAARDQAVLTNTASSSQDLFDGEFCSTNAGNVVTLNAINGQYTLTCGWAVNTTKMSEVKWITLIDNGSANAAEAIFSVN